MPQMAPSSWINLFLLFITIFMIMNTLNYFSFKYENKALKTTPKLQTINWKW